MARFTFLFARSALCTLALLGATQRTVIAAPPPGHPSPEAALEMLKPAGSHPRPTEVFTGTVVTAIDANDYTYVEVREGDRQHWIAGPRIKLVSGETITFDKGVVITNFHSKLLQRTFPAVMFVARITRTQER